MSGDDKINLVTSWRSIETASLSRNIKDALHDLNESCGTNYKHSELSKMARGERSVKHSAINYMQEKMLTSALLDLDLSHEQIKRLIEKIRLPDMNK